MGLFRRRVQDVPLEETGLWEVRRTFLEITNTHVPGTTSRERAFYYYAISISGDRITLTDRRDEQPEPFELTITETGVKDSRTDGYLNPDQLETLALVLRNSAPQVVSQREVSE